MYRGSRLLKIICMSLAIAVLSDISVFAQVTDFTPVVIDEEEHEGDIPDGIWYGPLDLSGMSYDEAKKSIILYVMSLQDKKITLLGENGEKTVKTAGELGLRWSDEGALREALTFGKSGNVVSRFKELKDLEMETKKYDLKLSFDDNKLREVVDALAQKYNVDPTETTMVKEEPEEDSKSKKKKKDEEPEEPKFIITEGNTGYKLDTFQTTASIKEALTDWDGTDKVVKLAINVEEPRGKKEDLMKVKDIIGSFYTKFGSSSSDRTGNLRTGVGHINGTILYPGEEFSTYETVSPFTEENGYFLAGSYLNGTVVETFGGGICQVSTTLYNAVLMAELEVIERHNHSMVVNYVDISGDAAISGTEKDFKFRNNKDFPIYIEGIVSKDKKLIFNIYGVETRPENRTIELRSIETGRLEPEQHVVEDPTKPIGYMAVSGGHIGYSGEYWKIVKVDGEETERERINVSNYQSTPTTIVKGTGLFDQSLLAGDGAAGDAATP